MKRLVLCALAVALLAPASASGFNSSFDYIGHVKGDATASVGFLVGHSASGHRKVAGFTVAHVPYTCKDAPSDVTAGWRFSPKMRIGSHEMFHGRGDWVDLPLDPSGAASGKLRRNGVAVGTFRIHGELAGTGTHCRTGLLDWRATRQPPPN